MGNEYLDFVTLLQRLYLEQQDVYNILSSIDENTSWIGTGRQEICKSFSEAAQALILEKKEYDGGFTVTNSWYETSAVVGGVCVVYGEFWATPKDEAAGMADLHHRISAVCAKTEAGMKLLHLHMSIPDDDQESDEYYVKSKAKVDHQTLRRRFEQTSRDLHSRSQELEILTANIPGGVHKCKNDPELTLENMSSGFFSLFGYTGEEITELFHDCFMRMIYSDDRAVVASVMKGQLSRGTTVGLEYRVKCKDGSLMWVLDRGRLVTTEDGTEHFFCMMMDITARKAEDERLRLALERHKVIMDQATDIIFEWDILADTIDFSSNWEKRFGYPPIRERVTQMIPLSENIHPEDMNCFMKIMVDTAEGVPYSETEFRIRSSSGEYSWCRIRATAQFDSNNRPIKAVGVIVGIEEEKARSNLLMEAAQRDALTQLYNKGATRAKIERLLSDKNGGMLHALMIIDVDDFKGVNDRFGHQCGDAVLFNMAKALKKLFRTTDVVGRIGGDEFLVFMANVSSRELAAARAKEIVRIFGEIPAEIGGELSCSVGVSLYPHDGTDYTTLSRCADKALYGVKHKGKGDFAFYDSGLCEDAPYVSMRTAINGCADPAENGVINQELVQRIFLMLYDTTDMNASINHILQTVGSAYNVSRAYIFESSKDGLSCSNTFEWCNAGVAPQMQNLKDLSFETDLKGFFDLYDENGVFYCQDIETLSPNLRSVLKPQGVVSMLQCFIKDGGAFRGYVGFDECGENRYWTKEQVNTLSLVSNILSTFLIKQRLNEQLAQLRGCGKITTDL